MVRRLGAAVMAIGLAVGAAFGQCEHLYTDNQARALTKRAEATVPKAQFRRKPLVLKSLGIDIHRLLQPPLSANQSWSYRSVADGPEL